MDVTKCLGAFQIINNKIKT